jgi:hypothetical protein
VVGELAVARLHVPPGPCEPRCSGRLAVVPVSLADSVSGLVRPGCLPPWGRFLAGGRVVAGDSNVVAQLEALGMNTTVTATTGPMVIASTTSYQSRPQVVGGGRITACP